MTAVECLLALHRRNVREWLQEAVLASRTGDLPCRGRAAAFVEREADARVFQVEAATTPLIVNALGLVLAVRVVPCLMPMSRIRQ